MCTYITETETVTEAETFNEETEEHDTYSVCVEETETSIYSDEDLCILSRLIYRESGGCSWK